MRNPTVFKRYRDVLNLAMGRAKLISRSTSSAPLRESAPVVIDFSAATEWRAALRADLYAAIKASEQIPLEIKRILADNALAYPVEFGEYS